MSVNGKFRYAAEQRNFFGLTGELNGRTAELQRNLGQAQLAALQAINLPAFSLAAADDAPAGSLAAGLGDDGALAFGVIVSVEIDDDPIGLPAQLVSPCGIRIKGP